MKLEEHPFIQSIPPARRGTILAELDSRPLAAGEMLFEEGSDSDALYLILEGSIAFTKMKSDGSRQEISHAEAGAFFGEVGVFTKQPRTLGAIARETAVVCRVPQPTVERTMEDALPVRIILDSVIEHLNSTTGHYLHEVMRTEKLTVVGTMVSSILHDFKNPFASIGMAAHLIKQRHKDDEKTGELCRKMEVQIDRMVEMANDLAAFAKGESALSVAALSVDQLFRDFAELNESRLKASSATVEFEGNGCTLEGDAGKLLRVLQNLVDNAIDAVRGQGESGKISVRAESKGEELELTVADNGPGIPESIRETFFEPFVTEGKANGTGLGTAVVQSFVQAHRGSIDFKTGSSGTSFMILLPKKQKTG